MAPDRIESELPEETSPAAERPPRRRLRYLLVIVGLLVIVAALGGIKFAQISALIGMGKQMEKAGPPPETVGSDRAVAQDWENTISAVGTLVGAESVAVSNDAPGVVRRILFKSGDRVKRGQVLVELDASTERAELASAAARRDNAASTEKRTRALVDVNALTKEALDQDQTALRTTSHDVQALQAQIARKTVRAPFDGRLGIRAIDVGQYLTPGTTVTVLDRGNGMFADFTLPQEQIAEVAVGMPVRVLRPRETDVAATGTIVAIAPTVDPTTRNVKLRASVEGAGAGLLPGMFVNVEVVMPARASVVALPATAIVHASYGDSVFVIEDKPAGSPGMAKTPDGQPVKIARQHFVRRGRSRGDFVAIEKGVTAGQEVVSAGAFKLRNGAPVVVNNKVKPRAELDPKPENR
jgi:membrane fusion protein, multidrug efflux system